MHYIALDTCTWIYLANGTEPVKLLDFLFEESGKGNIAIIVPKVVIDEWEKNKIDTVEKGAIKHFKQVIEQLKRVSRLLGKKGERPKFSFLIDEEDETEYFEEVIEKIKGKREEVKAAIQENINKIDEIFNHPSTIILGIEDKIKLLAGQHAVEKKAPFKEKNSYADALILFSFIDYVTQNKIEGASFVTYNTEDFCEKSGGKKYLHPDLKPYFTESKSNFYLTVGEVLNTIKEDIITKEELEWVKQMQLDAERERDIEYCQICSEMHGRPSELYFSSPIEIFNEREVAQPDPNQLELAFAKNIPKTTPEEIISTVQIADCSYCGTEHFKCQKCGTVNAVWDHEYNMRKECEGCGLPYFIDTSNDYENIGEGFEYRIIKDYLDCEKCGEQFEDNLTNTGLCQKCEDEYAHS